MKTVSLKRILDKLDEFLEPQKFDDVSNNGLQIARRGEKVSRVAFAVDGSVKSVKAAIGAGAQLLVVHHGISWNGGIRSLTGGTYEVVKAAMDADLALAAYHLPLDANRELGHNWELARALGLRKIESAFSWRGQKIGVVGEFPGNGKQFYESLYGIFKLRIVHIVITTPLSSTSPLKIGICSGGGGEFAAEAQRLGCDVFLTGEADWGEKIAAENIGMPIMCLGHYETETFGLKALAKKLKRALGVATTLVALMLCCTVSAAEEEAGFSRFYAGASGALVLPQGGQRLSRLGGGALRFGWYATENFALEGEAAWLENRAGLGVRGIGHWRACEWYDRMFGFSPFDPFCSLGVRGWMNDGQVGPCAGLGALYYLSDNWALRFEGDTTLGLDTRVGMVYQLAVGVQYSF